jgi:hypothetical protein
MTYLMRTACLAVALWVFGFANATQAQENLDAGKSGSQLYAASCSICHKLPDGVAKAEHVFALESFLREHYTASKESAAMVADYLKSVSKEQVVGRSRSPKRAKAQVKHKQEKPKDDKATENKAEDKNKGEPKSAKPEGKAKTDISKSAAPKPAEKPKSTPNSEGTKPAGAEAG